MTFLQIILKANKMFFKQRKWLSRGIFCLTLLCLNACTGLKLIPANQQLYTGAKLKWEANGNISDRKMLEAELEKNIRPKPNKSYFGNRPGVWFYYKSGNPEKKKGLGNWIRKKLGEKPVFLTDANPDRTAQLLAALLHNYGYFEATAETAVEKKEKTASVTYTLRLITPAYRLRQVDYKKIDSVYPRMTERLNKKPLLKPGKPYRLSDLDNELTRIGQTVRDSGYYFFDSRYLIFDADTSAGERQVDLELNFENKIPRQARIPYRLDSVDIVNDYLLGRTDATRKRRDSTHVRRRDSVQIIYDTLRRDGYRYIDRKKNFRPEVIIRSVNLVKDSIYRRRDQERTLKRLTDLGTFKFVNVRFIPRPDSILKVNVLLTPLLKKSFRAEAQINSKSNNFVGPAVSLSFVNRNFLGGAELFQARINTAYEVQVSGQQSTPVNSFELGSEVSLTVPRFISLVPIPYQTHNYMPRTTFRLNYRGQRRVNFFQLNSFNISYGYLWRETERKNHELYPVDITYFRLGQVSEAFNAQLERNPFLRRSFENQFILGSRYSFTYNTQTGEQASRQTENFYFNGNLDVSGNLAYLTQSLTDKRRPTPEQPYQIASYPYSQYTRADVDLRYYRGSTANRQLAARLIAGSGFSYGNSSGMPYVKQFSSGGSNSLRAFRARSVGPGSYDSAFNSEQDSARGNFFIDQTADIKLESNVEYRFGIAGYFKGAVFVDAGNVWLFRADSLRPGANFRWDSFLREMAVGTGAGLRVDAGFFVLRLDLAFPLRKPFLPENERWVFNQIAFGDRTWRRNNLILNIGIGYPF
jgi:outer membrane protein insertion porin family